MQRQELIPGTCYAWSDSVSTYLPRDAQLCMVVDNVPWVLEYTTPVRTLRRPTPGRGRKDKGEASRHDGELPQEYPTAFKGVWVLSAPEGIDHDVLRQALARARSQVDTFIGAPVPELGGGIETKVLIARQIHMPWGQHLENLPRAARIA